MAEVGGDRVDGTKSPLVGLVSVIAVPIAFIFFITCYSLWSNLGSNAVILDAVLIVLILLSIGILWFLYPLEPDEISKDFVWIITVFIVYPAISLNSGELVPPYQPSYFMLFRSFPCVSCICIQP